MYIVFKIGITEKNNKEIENKDIIEVIAAKGIIGDRYFHDYNGDREQITLIESENIDYYNDKYNSKFPYLIFRRNLITKNIKLNDLVGKTFLIGKIKVKGNDLCRPCIELEKKIGAKNYLKEFLRKGGLRCEIIESGVISIGDKIII